MRFWASCICAAPLLLFSTLEFHEVADNSGMKILSPALSEMKTRKLLSSHGMKLLLISDPQATTAGASIAVGVGSYADPKQYPGTAHYVEHLLFLGSSHYPKEDEIMGYIGDHAGSINAYTAPDKTVYMFSVQKDGLREALLRFGDMFANPLFNPSGIERELNAVDEEHKKNIENDIRRSFAVHAAISNPNHPKSQFLTGNKETLSQIPLEEVRSWFESYYLSSNSALVIYGPQSLDTLQEWAVESFGAYDRVGPAMNWKIGPFMQESMKGKLCVQKAIQQEKLLFVMWELPEEIAEDWKSKSVELIGYALSKEGEGTLLTTLQKEGLVSGMSPSKYQITPSNAAFFVIFSLTEKGVGHPEIILEHLFSALKVIQTKGIPPSLFTEMKTIEELEYLYQERLDPFRDLGQYSALLLQEPIESFPRFSLLLNTYEPKKITAAARCLNPKNGFYHLIANQPDSTTSVEQWYGIPYQISTFSEKEMLAFSSPSKEISLAKENRFIPKKLEPTEGKVALSQPKEVINTLYEKVYYLPDTTFNDIKGCARLRIFSPLFQPDPTSIVKQKLYIELIRYKLAALLKEGSMAGIECQFSPSFGSIELAFSGYADKLSLYIESVLHGIKDLRCTAQEFEQTKEIVKKSFLAQSSTSPLYQAICILSSEINPLFVLQSEGISVLETLSYEEMGTWSSHVFEKGFTYGIVGGNFLEKEAIALAKKPCEILKYKSLSSPPQLEAELCVLRKGPPHYLLSRSQLTGNALVLLIQTVQPSEKERAAFTLVPLLIGKDFFTELRTKQQTGYIVKADTKTTRVDISSLFLIQSTTYSPEELLYRTESFLDRYVKSHEQISQERFMEVKETALQELRAPFPSFADQFSTAAKELFDWNGNFGMQKKLADTLEGMSYTEFYNYFTEFLSRKEARRLAILVQDPSPTFAYTPPSETLSLCEVCEEKE